MAPPPAEPELTQQVVPAAVVGLNAGGIAPLALVSGPEAAAITPELDALAEALGNDPVAIFNYVRNKIVFQPYYGSCKGAHTTYLDAAGNDMDQASLLIALLNAAGYADTSYVYGRISVRNTAPDEVDLTHWLQTTATARNYWVLAYARYPNISAVTLGGASGWRFDHVWVRVVIGGVTYDIDPSFKMSDVFSGIDCKTASGYSRSEVLTDAGGTQGADYVEGVSRSGVENRLGTYATTLRNFLRANHPGAEIEEIIGGGKIRETTVPSLSAAAAVLSGLNPTVTSSFTVLPAQYRATFTVKVGTQIDATFNADSLQGRRVSLVFAGQNARLWLADTLVASESNGSGATASVTLSLTYPAPILSKTLGVENYRRSGSYDLTCIFHPNPFSNGQISTSERLVREYLAAGKTDTSREVLTESLRGLALRWARRVALNSWLVTKTQGCMGWNTYILGRAGQEDSYYVDMPGLLTAAFDETGNLQRPFTAISKLNSAMEHGVIEQTGGGDAVSTMKCLALASDGGQRVYRVTSANWSSVKNALNNYTTGEKNHIESYVSGNTLLVHRNGDTSLNDWTGYGFEAVGPNGDNMIISGGYSGGFLSVFGSIFGSLINLYLLTTSEEWFSAFGVLPALSAEPVDLATGAYTLTATDLTLGEAGTPRGLVFSRAYDSSRSDQRGGLGHGWRHSCEGRVMLTSELEAGFGLRQPTDAVSSIVGALAVADFVDTSYTAKELLTGSLAANWLANRIRNNAANVQLGEQRLTYISQPGGNWNPPPGATTALTGTSGALVLQPRFGGSVVFDAQNRVSQWKDVDNNTQTYLYDGNGRLATVTDSQNRVLTFGYTGTNPLIQNVSDGTGRSVVFSYMGSNLTGVQDVEGYNQTFVYDTRNRLEEWKDHNGAFFVKNFYDAWDRVYEQHSQGDVSRLWKFLYAPGMTREIDPFNKITTHLFDAKLRRVGHIDPLGNRTTVTYDSQNHIRKTVDGSGRQTTFTFDGNQNLTHITDNDNKTTIRQYDASLRLWKVIDPTNRVTEFGYDAENHLKTVTDPGLRVTTYFYRADGRIDRITDNDNKSTIVTAFDQWANPTHVTRPDNTTTVSVFNARGDRTSLTDGRNHTSHFGHDKRRLLTSFTDTENYTSSFTYDSNGYPDLRTDRNFKTTDFGYDNFGKLLTVAAPNTGLVQYGYNERDEQTSMTDGLLHTWNFGFDDAGRPETITDPLTIVTSRTFYDGADRVSEHWNGLNQKTKNFYDSAGRREYTLDPLNRRVDFGYDDAGRPETVKNRLGRTFSTDYAPDGLPFRFYRPSGLYSEIVDRDPVGRPKTVREPSGQQSVWTYDGMGRPKTKTDELGLIEWDYDDEGNPETVTEGSDIIGRTFDNVGRVETCTDTHNETVSYTYDGEGNIETITYPGNRTVTYTYDGSNRLKSVTDWANRLTEYFYDDAGRLRRVERPNGTQQRLEYDDANRLRETFEEHGTVMIWTGSYGYDNAYRLTTFVPTPPTRTFAPPPASMGYNLDNQLESYNGQSVASDLDGNMQAAPINGSLLGALAFDVRNRLTGAGGITYAYDAENRRTQSIQNGQPTSYTWSRGTKLDRLLVKNNPDGSVTRYIHGQGLLYEETTPAGGGAPTLRFYHYNWQGSTMALTDAAGTVTARLSYSPYGEATVVSGSPDTPFLFNGKYGVMTEPNGLLCMQARFYSPILRRFLSEDPAGFAGGINLYAYSLGDPVNLMDPFGLGPAQSDMLSGVLGFVTDAGQGIFTGTIHMVGQMTGVNSMNNAYFFWQQGDYFNAIGWTINSLLESAVTVLTFGQGSTLLQGTRTATQGTSTLVHMSRNADSILASGNLGLPGNIYAGPASNATLSGWSLTARTGLSPFGTWRAVPIPAAGQSAFSRVVPIGPMTTWQSITGQQYTAQGVMNLSTGAFTRTGVNWNQVGIYGFDATVSGSVLGGAFIWSQGE